jgi:2-alkenal reductase
MSLGIVSGLGRSLESQRQTETFRGRYTLPEVIQTDAPINPGNSGGPLITLNGEVVGINSAIRSITGVNSGVGFSIPVNAVQRIAPVLINDGSYSYAYIGVQIQSLNLNLQEIFELPQADGAYVTSVTEGGPAEEAGLIAADEDDGTGGDLIVAIDGTPVSDTEELISYLVFHTEIGQTVDLSVIRDGETITLPLTLGERP